MNLHLDWCSHDAAKYAVEHWHYSKQMPNQKTAKIGVWESGAFVGAVVFGDGANNNLFKPYGLDYTQGCELVRIALRSHVTTVSRILSLSLKMLCRYSEKLRLVVSFADPEHGHVGLIYQASNWVYAGETTAADEYIVKGVRMHGRALRSTRSTHGLRALKAKNILDWTRQVIDPNAKAIEGSIKHRYLYPLDSEMRARILPLAKPYPKRATSIGSNVPVIHTGESGESPTVALHASPSAACGQD